MAHGCGLWVMPHVLGDSKVLNFLGFWVFGFLDFGFRQNQAQAIRQGVQLSRKRCLAGRIELAEEEGSNGGARLSRFPRKTSFICYLTLTYSLALLAHFNTLLDVAEPWLAKTAWERKKRVVSHDPRSAKRARAAVLVALRCWVRYGAHPAFGGKRRRSGLVLEFARWITEMGFSGVSRYYRFRALLRHVFFC